MSEGQLAPNLRTLEESYEILGELRVGEQSRMYVARRRDSGDDVVISVVRAPKGGENNALNHFAADTQLLSKIEHPQVPQVIEGRWVGKDEFAVVTERRIGDTLGQVLARGEKFSAPRIATILQEASAILDWARSNGVVHRGITIDSLAFEQGTNRVLVSLVPTPIPIEGVPDAAADAQTVGMLAWAMLTGHPRTDDRPLRDFRSDLATRVVDETEKMVRARRGARVPDVATFVAVIAAADALKAGELEIAEMEAQLLEARRAEVAEHEAEKEAFAARTRELEAQLADERADFERRMAAEEAELASVKEEFAALKAHEESQIEAERRQLDVERREFDARVAELEARRAELDERLAEVARVRAEEGKRIDAAIAAAVETVAATAAEAEKRRLAEEGEEWKLASRTPENAPWVADTVRRHAVGQGEMVVADVPAGGRPRWLIPSATIVVALILLTLGIGYSQRRATANLVKVGNTVIVPTPPVIEEGHTPRGGFLSQSAGGVAPTGGAPVAGATNPDSVAQTPAQPTVQPTPQGGIQPPVQPPNAGQAGTSSPASGAVPRPVVPPAVPGAAGTTAPSAAGAATAIPTAKPNLSPAPPAPAARRPQTAFSAELEAIERADSARRAAAAGRRDTTRARVRPDTLR